MNSIVLASKRGRASNGAVTGATTLFSEVPPVDQLVSAVDQLQPLHCRPVLDLPCRLGLVAAPAPPAQGAWVRVTQGSGSLDCRSATADIDQKTKEGVSQI